MKLISWKWLFHSIVVLAIAWQVSLAEAAEVKGVQFADSLTLGEEQLEIRGVAVMHWALFFDVYIGAFYLPPQISSENWEEEVPKALEISYLRKISAEDFVSASDKLLRQNLSVENYQKLAGRLDVFYGYFRDVAPGDRYTLTYQPAFGTELKLNDQVLGVVPGLDFAVAYFGLWLGHSPISESFRDRLMGRG